MEKISLHLMSVMFRRFILIIIILSGICSASLSAQASIVIDLENQLKENAPDSLRLRLHFDIASNFYSITPAKVLEHVDSIIVLARKLDREVFYFRALYFRAVAHYLSGDLNLAEEVLTKVDSSGFFNEDLKSLMDVYNLLGTVLSSRGKVSDALSYQYRALEIARKMQDQDRQVTALTNIAQTYTDNLDTIRSMDYYHEALQMAEFIGDTISIAVINNNMSGVTQDPDRKLEYAGRALMLFESLDYTDGIAHASNEFALGLRIKKSYVEALTYLYRSIKIWKDNSFNIGLVTAYTNLGVVHGYLNNIDSANFYFDLAEQLGLDLEDKIILKDAYEEMAEMFENLREPAQALSSLKKAAALKDILYSEERASQLALAETDFKTREKEQRLAEQQLTIARQKNTQKNAIIGGSIFILLALGWLQYLRYRHQLRRNEADLALKLEKADAEKLRELDRFKTDFFTNISHEFRTPLTLIKTPLKQALKNSESGQNISILRQHALTMDKNADQLLQLVNQLLDLAKLEEGKMQLSVASGDLAQFIRAIGYGFESMALRKQIEYHVIVQTESVVAWYDQEKIEHILSNLLSNAFKFTPIGGRISLEAKFTEEKVDILVRDTGVGISPDRQPRIFDRFFSIAESIDTEGSSSGVGLALTKELVNLHRGTIEVESAESIGSTFFVSIPIAKDAYHKEQRSEKISTPYSSASRSPQLPRSSVNGEDLPNNETKGKVKPLVLVIEDNDDLRNYMAHELQAHFQVKTAIHGLEGLKKAVEIIPDLIITDVMMPEMDGTQLCHELRQKIETAHIPIIMLTAKADREGKIVGLEVGADDYLTKPFDHEELLVRAQNLIRQRLLLRRRFANEVVFKPSEIVTNSIDQEFLSKVLQTVEDNMENATFSVEDLGKAVSLSRSQLHRKLKAIADKSPNDLIRAMRLQRAHDLLRQKSGTASEIAYQVGFNSLSYFSKCFRDQFGITPSEVEGHNSN